MNAKRRKHLVLVGAEQGLMNYPGRSARASQRGCNPRMRKGQPGEPRKGGPGRRAACAKTLWWVGEVRRPVWWELRGDQLHLLLRVPWVGRGSFGLDLLRVFHWKVA